LNGHRSLATTEEVAEYLGMPRRTLDQWRHVGKGPRFSKVGKHVRYRWADVEKWLDANAQGGEAA
jgi:excisionase family DNA binding protein